MVRATGVEPLNATGHRSDKNQPQDAQELDSKEVMKKLAQQIEDTLGPNKDKNGDFSCCTGVAQEASVLHELEQVVGAWGKLSANIRKAIVLIATAAKR
jgi:hypothetical protein